MTIDQKAKLDVLLAEMQELARTLELAEKKAADAMAAHGGSYGVQSGTLLASVDAAAIQLRALIELARGLVATGRKAAA